MAKNIIEAQAERIARAVELVDERAYIASAHSIFVYSDRPGVPGYEVYGNRCTCPDATIGWASRHLNGCCKHVEAARIILQRQTSAGTTRIAA